jgi:LysM repeat protein
MKARLGVAFFGFVLLVPVAFSLRDDRATVAPSDAPGGVAIIVPAGGVTLPPPVTAASTAAPSATAASLPVTSPSTAPPVTAAPAAQAAVAAERLCAQRFTVRPGDYWIGLAEGAQVTLRQLLDVNGATTNTPLYPGRDICLPEGARTPPATTTTVATTAAPPTTARPASPPTTARPASPPTTARPSAPATTAAPPATPPARSYSRDELIQIVRDVWPDELEEQAIRIAQRESNFRPTAKNFCCYGLFQVYYQVHRGWLAGIGVTSGEQLLDPVVNARAAYTLYQRAGGWGPWRQTGG